MMRLTITFNSGPYVTRLDGNQHGEQLMLEFGTLAATEA
jgi:hypothetical protein